MTDEKCRNFEDLFKLLLRVDGDKIVTGPYQGDVTNRMSFPLREIIREVLKPK